MADSRRVMVIAGGDWQVPLVRKIRQMGFVALNSNLYVDSPAFAFADVTLVADVLDKESNLEFARAQKADAVLTDQSDIAVPTVAYVCEKLGLPGIGVETAELFTNKFLMREFCAQHGFPTVRHRLCDRLQQAVEFSAQVGFPCVVKPPSNQSSRGVVKVSGSAGLEGAYAEASRYSANDSVLIEEFIGGVELTVEGLKLPGGHRSLAVSRKEHYSHNPMIAKRLLYSHEDEDIDYHRLRLQHDQMIDAMGLGFGITHTEYKYDHDQFYLIEAAARGGGTRISSDIVPLMSGVDVNEVLVRMALGEEVDAPAIRRSGCCAALEFWEFEPGLVTGISGLEDVLATPGVVTAGLVIRPGDVVRPPQDDRLRHGFVISHAGSKPALQRLLSEIRSRIVISYA